MLPRKRFSTKLTQTLGPFFLFEHTEPIVDLQMDVKGNLIINQKLATHQGRTLAGFTVLYHDAKEGKLLLRQENLEQPKQRKPFIDY
jgi:hypothetical protein